MPEQPQDIGKAKRNVAKMVSMGAPEKDIDAYISSEGLTLDQIRNFKSQPTQPQPTPMQNAGNYLAQEYTGAGSKLRSNPVAGGAQLLNVGLQAPFVAGDAALRQLAEHPAVKQNPLFANVIPTALDLAGLIPQLGSKLGEAATKSGLGYAGLAFPNLGTTPEKAQQIRTELPKLGGTLGAFGTGELLRGAGAVKGAFEKGRNIQLQKTGNASFLEANPARVKEVNVMNDIQKGSPFFAEELRTNPIDKSKGADSPMRQGVERGTNIMQRIFDERMNPAVEHFKDIPIDIANEVKKPILAGLTDVQKWANPEKMTKIENYIQNGFPDEMTLGKTRDFISALNTETSGYWKASPSEKAAMFTSDPAIAAKVDLANILRDKMIETTDRMGAPGVREFRKEYGAVRKMTDMMYRNIVPAERQGVNVFGGASPVKTGLMLTGELYAMLHNPVAAGIGIAGGAARGLGMVSKLKNAKIAKAFDSWAKSDLTPTPYQFTPPTNAGLLPTGEKTTTVPSSTGWENPQDPAGGYFAMGAGADKSGIRQPPFIPTQAGNRLLGDPRGIPTSRTNPNPPPGQTIAPEYQSRASGFPNAAPQMADQLRVLQQKFASGEFTFEQYLAGLKEIPNMENMMRVIAQQKYPK